MVSTPGPLLARGRDADVFDVGGGRVLRRYRREGSTLEEAAIMQLVSSHGYPVPEVHEVSGPSIVMDRVTGPTLLEDVVQRPWRIRWGGRLLAELHHRLHAIQAPDWVPPRLGGGGSVVHFDLHPANVVVAPDGPVVIDWTNAGAGEPDREVTHTWLLMQTSVPPGGAAERLLAAVARRAFVSAFLAGFDREALRPHLGEIAAHRRADRNVLDVEREAINRFLARNGTPAG